MCQGLGASVVTALVLGALIIAALLALAPVATARDGLFASTTSANWSGYAIHGDGVHFTHASGIWTVPKPRCVAGQASYAATWVGIGGYALDSKALEQTGTETDCRRNGSTRTTAWLEVVPAPSRRVPLMVRPGDLIAASVSVQANAVTLTLMDLTTHRHFTKQITARHVDTSSAEWIVEAPSNCDGASNCRTLPLADFGTVSFTHASVHTTRGQIGTIASLRWDATKIVLRNGHSPHAAALEQIAQAIPTALTDAGAAFAVDYALLDAPQPPGVSQTQSPQASTRLP